MPIAGGSVDRRTLEHLYNAYNDDTIHCYMCFLCSEKHVHVKSLDHHEDAKYKGTIEYHTVKRLVAWLEPQEGDSSDVKWVEDFYFDTFRAAVYAMGGGGGTREGLCTGFSDFDSCP